jgi:hypothetical protein
VLLYAGYSGIEQAKFYGFGNDTVRDSNLSSSNLYDAQQDQIIVNPVIEVPLFGGLKARTGVAFKHASSVETNGRLIGTLQPEGTNGMSVGSAEAGLVFETSSGAYPFVRRFSSQVTVREAPSIFSNPAAFGKVRGEMTAVYATRVLTNVQLAVHASGERTWGTYPFFEAAYLGGVATRSPLDPTGVTAGNLLRGYDLNRFAGDAVVAANTDLNVELGRWSTFLPLRYGVFGLFDIGRVFVDGQSSSKWHNAAGGGISFRLYTSSPFLQLAATFRAALVHTEDGLSFFFASGFGI